MIVHYKTLPKKNAPTTAYVWVLKKTQKQGGESEAFC